MRPALAIVLLALAACTARPPESGLASAEDVLVVPPPDAWEGQAADLPDQQRCVPVPPARVAPVEPLRRKAAVERLRQVAIVPLTLSQAAELAPRAVVPGTVPYLVRAVAKNPATGAFEAQFCGDVLWISHHSLGRAIPPSERLPLVVFLERPPGRLFVSVGVAM